MMIFSGYTWITSELPTKGNDVGCVLVTGASKFAPAACTTAQELYVCQKTALKSKSVYKQDPKDLYKAKSGFGVIRKKIQKPQIRTY